MSTWHPPTEFDGYRLEKLLGRGGMGQVHLARDSLLDRFVAIKFIASKTDPESVERRRFLIEARAIARLQHPTVVTVHRVGEIDGRPYLVSEYVEGTDLDELERPLPTQQVLQIGYELARGLAVAHRQGVVHRDIKPANVMLTSKGQVKLLDFGIAKLLDPDGRLAATTDQAQDLVNREETAAVEHLELERAGNVDQATAAVQHRDLETGDNVDQATAAVQHRDLETGDNVDQATADVEHLDLEQGSFTKAEVKEPQSIHDASQVSLAGLTKPGIAMGTPAFMAPELWLGRPATFAVDVYSLGALLFTLCRGEPPHRASTMEELGRKATGRDAPSLGEGVRGLPERLVRIVDRCLARDPAERFADGNEVRAALDRLLNDRDGSEIPEGNPYRGLQAFEPEHRGLYFGRDSEIRTLLDKLRNEPLIVVVGDSGAGKSSLCRAGVLPRVSRWLSEDGRRWKTATIVPGAHPVEALTDALSSVAGSSEWSRALDDPCEAVRRFHGQLGDSTGVVLFLDQLEELITLAPPEQRETFVELFSWLITPSGPIRIIATIRGDFISRMAAIPQLTDAVAKSLFFLWPLSRERVSEAIRGPAASQGVTFESQTIIDELVESTVTEDGGLPLLQFTLSKLWDMRDREKAQITAGSLAAIGGVSGALSLHADEAIARLTPTRREIAKLLLLQLVSGENTRKRRSRDDLAALHHQALEVLDALVSARLVLARDTAEGPAYEIAHEAMITSWSSLASWLAESSELRRSLHRLEQATREWLRLDQAPTVLWRAAQLEALPKLDRVEIPEDARRFLAASRRALRRKKVRTWAIAAALPLMLVVAYAVFALGDHIQTQRHIDGELETSRRALEALSVRRRTIEEQRERARSLFESTNIETRGRGEALWQRANADEAAISTELRELGGRLEALLLLDQDRSDLRALFAELLTTRISLAEARRNDEERRELLARLQLHDDNGHFLAKLARPATVKLSLEPASASLSLTKHLPDKDGRLREVDLPARELHAPGGATLEPGSYRITAEAPGHAPASLPLLLNPGETVDASLVLPAAASAPDDFVVVPAGTTLFGSDAQSGLRRNFFNALPLLPRRVESFLIARRETTFAEWIEYLEVLSEEERARRLPRINGGGLELRKNDEGRWRLAIKFTTVERSALQGDPLLLPEREKRNRLDWSRLPVVGVSAEDAVAYAAWRAKSGGVPGARLCSELEWERAARGADGRHYPHGQRLTKTDANFDETYAKLPAQMGLDEVGSHPSSRSPFGVDDLTGNAWEWTTSVLTPGGFTARGGSFYHDAISARIANREEPESSYRDISVGLRLCADLR